MSEQQPQLYTDLADWYPLLTSPEDYPEEAGFYLHLLTHALGAAPRTLLELGAGGGHMASHDKQHVRHVPLTDACPQMLALSERLNPDCEHVQGDMRTLRLGRVFDAVFVHDAVDYLTREADLRQAIETAFVQCRPGGVVVFAPDHVREKFAEGVETGGHDDGFSRRRPARRDDRIAGRRRDRCPPRTTPVRAVPVAAGCAAGRRHVLRRV